jgi:hypothetical protein
VFFVVTSLRTSNPTGGPFPKQAAENNCLSFFFLLLGTILGFRRKHRATLSSELRVLVYSGLFNDAVSNSNYTASNDV